MCDSKESHGSSLEEEEEIENLMYEGFVYEPTSQSQANRVTATSLRVGDSLDEIHEGVPCNAPVPNPPTSDFVLTR